MTRFYLDTSIAVHALRRTAAAQVWFDHVTRQPEDGLFSSRILQTELTRVLRRDGESVSGRELILRHVAIVPITESILTTAESITEHVKTLDSIHLASAIGLGSDTVVVTHDDNLKRVAAVLGLATFDPVAASISEDPAAEGPDDDRPDDPPAESEAPLPDSSNS